ncbi:flavin-containing monooxygenase [Actibacterium ureilyticum]|uniref:flavin-containing monooxygenase n=1 Tax=Actibacterium ureilyticum TaxID=1590614 RepID=UPI000BAAB331|nr:NAD(P)/FAD-dependent oxidoreductase [Actibacterium ureilyticum]
MPVETVDILVVGAGQAGIAMSEHLGALGLSHLVLERARIAERWRTGRWDSLVANGPAWHDRFPGMEFPADHPDAFVPKDRVADYFAAYARQIDAPVRCGVDVTRVTPLDGRSGFRVETSDGVIEANSIVAATGPFQKPLLPTIVPADAGFTQMHSAQYRNPAQLGEGAVLVVGAGSSGVQIADELLRAGRNVYLSVGPHERLARRYRNRDYVWWLGVLGLWDRETVEPGAEHIAIAVSGAQGGQTVDFRKLAARGMTLVGRTESFGDGKLTFAGDLAQNIRNGDRDYLGMLRAADAHVAANGLDLPEEPEAHEIGADPDCMTDPIRELDLADAGITTIIWATGYGFDFGWLQVDTFDAQGKPLHCRGVSRVPGVYFLGLPWLTRRGSSFIYGVWHDAKHLADHIAIRKKYAAYDGTAEPVTNTP